MYFQRKSTVFPSSCFRPLSLRAVMLLLSAEASFKPCCPFFWGSSKHLPQKAHLWPPFPCTKDVDIHILYRTFCWHYWHIWNRQPTSYPYIHKLLHTDTVLQAYTLIECLEREVFDERYAVYLYIIDLCTELDGLGFLASDDGTYIMTVKCWRCGHWLSALQTFPFSCTTPFWWWKDAYDNPGYIGVKHHYSLWIPSLWLRAFQKLWSYGLLKHSCPGSPLSFLAVGTMGFPPHSCICCADALYPAPTMPGIYL